MSDLKPNQMDYRQCGGGLLFDRGGFNSKKRRLVCVFRGVTGK